MEQKQLAKELHKPVRRNFKREPVRTYKINEYWAADLVDMAKKKDGNYRYILTVVDIHSRYAWAFPLKTKTGGDVATAFKKIKARPEFLWVDKGSEFYNREVKKELKGTKIYSTESGMKSVYAERFNRTLKNMMFRKFTELQDERWTRFLKDLIKEYNNTVHSSTNKKPADVYLKGDELITEIFYEKKRKPKFKIGDFVRISKVRGVFEKGYTQGWTNEVFKIVKTDKKRNPPTYYLEDLQGEEIKGKFYEEEMQKTDLKDYAMIDKILKTKGDKIFVSYVGWPEKFNEWISKKQVKNIKTKK